MICLYWSWTPVNWKLCHARERNPAWLVWTSIYKLHHWFRSCHCFCWHTMHNYQFIYVIFLFASYSVDHGRISWKAHWQISSYFLTRSQTPGKEPRALMSLLGFQDTIQKRLLPQTRVRQTRLSSNTRTPPKAIYSFSLPFCNCLF